ncbi:hypothetical protein ACFLR3_01775 [Campylobacterota bacterium]
MNNTNTINGLFHIPDEGSFLKKLILTYPTVYNPDIVVAFKVLQEIYPDLKLVHKDNYFALLLPTQTPGLSLEAMLITTEDDKQKLFSVYHRLHFDEQMYPQGPSIIEADAFLCLSAVLVNVPLENRIDALASLLNYQVQEAINIEITMLALADGDTSIAEENIIPFINNAIGRYMLACALDDLDYIRPPEKADLSHLVAGYCDLPLVSAVTGIQQLEDFSINVKRAEDIFIPDFASSTICLMFLLLEKKTSSAMLEEGSFKTIKEFFLDKKEIYKLKDIRGTGEMLGSFQQLSETPTEA